MYELNIKSELTTEMEDEIPSESGNLSYDLTVGSEEDDNNREYFHELPSQAEMNVQHFPPAENELHSQAGNTSFEIPATQTKTVVDGSNVRFEFTTGYRRNSSLLYLIVEKQLFTKKYAHNHMDRYTCYNKTCRASLLFDSYSNKIVKLYNPIHSHPDQSQVYKKMKVLKEMKDYCLTNDSANLTTKQIFDQKCNVMKEAAQLVEYQRVKRNLARLKKATSHNQTASVATLPRNISAENALYGIFSSDNIAASNDFASRWDSKTEPLERERNSSPAASEAESNNAAPDTSAFDANPLSTYRPDESNDVTQPLKKIKITHQQQSQFEEPFTEGYLEDYQSKIPKVSRRRSPPPPSQQAAQLRQKPRAPHRQDNAKHICTSCPCIAAQESEYDKIGKAWASELKMMSFDQQIYAKRAIAEILFEGQLGSLSRDSVKVLHEDPFVVEESEYVYDKSESNAAAVA